ncbi:hypothetical protein [Halomonas sp.]|uniref:hypothetical protein n=1 Tax=Halomonas sp. TaxID=1486246 RepID=UPI003568E9DB
MRQPIVGAIGLLWVVFIPLPVSADSVKVKDARFPTSFEANGRIYTLIGHGLFEYMIWDACAGAYYQAADTPQPSPQTAVPRHLELEYFHAIEAGDFAEATRDKVRETLYRGEDRALANALFGIWLGEEPLNAGFRDALLGR